MAFLTEDEKSLIVESFQQIAPNAEKAAELFYARLFEIDPSTEPLFKHVDLKYQGARLMNLLVSAVGNINDEHTLYREMQALGERHKGYGVVESQYQSVGAALIYALSTAAPTPLTDDTVAAWAKLYTFMAASAMK